MNEFVQRTIFTAVTLLSTMRTYDSFTDEVEDYFSNNPDEPYQYSSLVGIVRAPFQIFLYNVLFMFLFFLVILFIVVLLSPKPAAERPEKHDDMMPSMTAPMPVPAQVAPPAAEQVVPPQAVAPAAEQVVPPQAVAPAAEQVVPSQAVAPAAEQAKEQPVQKGGTNPPTEQPPTAPSIAPPTAPPTAQGALLSPLLQVPPTAQGALLSPLLQVPPTAQGAVSMMPPSLVLPTAQGAMMSQMQKASPLMQFAPLMTGAIPGLGALDPLTGKKCNNKSLSVLTSVRLSVEEVCSMFYNDIYLRWAALAVLAGQIHAGLFFAFIRFSGQKNALDHKMYVKSMYGYYIYSYVIIIMILLWAW